MRQNPVTGDCVYFRYSFISMEGLHKISADDKNQIKFSCSEPIMLHGVILYGSVDDNAEYDARVEIFSDTDSNVFESSFNRLTTTRMEHTYEIMFNKPLPLQSSKQYIVSLQLTGPPTKIGSGGKSDCVNEGVTFHFKNVDGSKTTVEKGQLPGLLFTVMKKKPSSGTSVKTKSLR